MDGQSSCLHNHLFNNCDPPGPPSVQSLREPRGRTSSSQYRVPAASEAHSPWPVSPQQNCRDRAAGRAAIVPRGPVEGARRVGVRGGPGLFLHRRGARCCEGIPGAAWGGDGLQREPQGTSDLSFTVFDCTVTCQRMSLTKTKTHVGDIGEQVNVGTWGAWGECCPQRPGWSCDAREDGISTGHTSDRRNTREAAPRGGGGRRGAG